MKKPKKKSSNADKIVTIGFALIVITALLFLICGLPKDAKGQFHALIPTLDADSIRGIHVSDHTPEADETLIYNSDSSYYIPGPMTGGSGLPLADFDDSLDAADYLDSTNLTNDGVGHEDIQPNAIGTSEIGDDEILEADLDCTDEASDNQVLTYDDASGGFSWEDDQTGGTTTYDNIGDPTTAGSITFESGETGTYTSAVSGWGGLIISNTVADQENVGSLLNLDYTDDGDDQAFYIVGRDNSATDTAFAIHDDGIIRAKSFYVNLGTDPDSQALSLLGIQEEIEDSLDEYLVSSEIMYNDGDTVSGTYVFTGSAYRGSSAQAESIMVTIETIEDSLALCARTSDVTWNDGDTLTGTYVFANAFRGNSGVVESTYVTLESIEDSLKLVGRVAGQVWTGTHDFGGATFEPPNGTNPSTATTQFAIDSDDEAFEVYITGESESALKSFYDDKEIFIFAPDQVNDQIAVFHVNSLLYPHGIEIDSVSITLPADYAYSMVFEEWAGDPPAAQNDVSTVTTGSSDSYASEAPDTDGNLDAGDYLFLDIPSDDVDWILCKVCFHTTEGD